MFHSFKKKSQKTPKHEIETARLRLNTYLKYKAHLSGLAEKAIEASGLTVKELVKRSQIARSKVSAIKNGALAGISSDLFLKVIAAAGGKVTFNPVVLLRGVPKTKIFVREIF
ncbi:MAG: XRE family transcriptional regulator [Pseudobdellovibrionaceae bacterium]